MAEDPGFTSLRNAFTQAKVGSDSDLDYEETSAAVAAITIKQLHVTYKTGNEYLRLDRLYEALQKCGTVKVFEFRGQGRRI